MPLDEVVYTRENLRRKLLDMVSILEKAAEEYDPSDVCPTGDLAFVMSTALSGVQEIIPYVMALKVHAENLADPSDDGHEAQVRLLSLIADTMKGKGRHESPADS